MAAPFLRGDDAGFNSARRSRLKRIFEKPWHWNPTILSRLTPWLSCFGDLGRRKRPSPCFGKVVRRLKPCAPPSRARSGLKVLQSQFLNQRHADKTRGYGTKAQVMV